MDQMRKALLDAGLIDKKKYHEAVGDERRVEFLEREIKRTKRSEKQDVDQVRIDILTGNIKGAMERGADFILKRAKSMIMSHEKEELENKTYGGKSEGDN